MRSVTGTKPLQVQGGYSLKDACQNLAKNEGVVASFSRALLEGLHKDMEHGTFDAALADGIDEIVLASSAKG